LIACDHHYSDNSPTIPTTTPIWTITYSTSGGEVTMGMDHRVEVYSNDPITIHVPPSSAFWPPLQDYDKRLDAIVGSLEWLRKARLERIAEILAWTRAAIEEFRVAARHDGLMLNAPIPERPRPVEHKNRYVRRFTKRRVCSGSSRYRVMAH